MQQKTNKQTSQSFSSIKHLITLSQQTYIQRKSKKIKIPPSSTRKTQQQTISQIHQQLNKYINSIDIRVKQIVQTYQTQLLLAYRSYVNKTKLQMQQIRKIAANNSKGDLKYQQKIDMLEKQLIIFRQQSLKLFQNAFKKDQTINNLSLEIKILKKQNKDYEERLFKSRKKNKQLQMEIIRLNQKQIVDKLSIKDYSQTIPVVLSDEIKDKLEQNVMFSKTSLLISKTSNFQRNKTIKDSQKSFQINNDQIRRQYNSLQYDKKLQKSQQLVSQKQSKQHQNSHHKVLSKTKYNLHRKKQNNKDEWLIKKSNDFAQRACLINIFKQAVQSIHNDIVKRKNIPSLKMFRANCPLDFFQFKKIDSYALFQLLFKNQILLQHIFNLIFNQK